MVVPLGLLAATVRSAPHDLDVLQQRDAPTAVLVDRSATWQPVRQVSVTVHLDAAPAADVVAPAWKGTVTAVLVQQGHALHAGDPIVEIDGIRRLFAPSPAPLWRVPAWGDRGADIDGLASLFAELGLMPAQPVGEPFGAVHVQAVERLATRIGAAPTSTLDLGWLVWSIIPVVEVPASPFALGAPAPAPGTKLIALSRTVTGVDVVGADGSPLGHDELRRSSVDFGGGDEVAGAALLDTPNEIPALHRQPADGPGPATAAAAPGSTGAAGAPSTPGASGSDATQTRRATARGEAQRGLAALPLGAVVTDLDGSHCLVTLDRRPLPVEIAGSDDARVYVRGGDGERVVANPASAFGVTSCH